MGPNYRHILFTFSIILTALKGLYGQEYTIAQYRGELNISISLVDEKRFEKAIKELNEQLAVELAAIKAIESLEEKERLEGLSKEYRKNIQLLVNASQNYHRAHEVLFQIYADNCERFRDKMKKMQHYAAGMQKAKYYEQRAERTLEKSVAIREVVLIADKPGWIQYKMAEALELEKMAIRDKGRALQIMQDFPVEYNYGWENDVTAEEVARAFKDPAINRPPDDLFVQDEQKTAVVTNVDTVNTSYENIVFKVQIAAHTEPLTSEYLQTIYKGNMSID